MIRHRLQCLRQQKKMSQRELARLVGLTQSQLSKIENGNRRVTAEELQSLATALGVSVTELIEDPKDKSA